MRIVLAHESIDTEGGVEAYLVSVIAELRRRGHDVAVLYHHRSVAPGPLGGSAPVAWGVEERGLDGVLAEVRAWKPDVCYSHNMGPLHVDRALAGEHRVVKMLHGFFGSCVSGLKMHAFPTEQVCERIFGPACLALYFPRRCGQLHPGEMLRGYRWASDQQALFARYAAIVVASDYMRDEMVRNGAPTNAVNVVPLFSTLEAGAVSDRGEADTVLFAGRMTRLKGGHLLVAAIARASEQLGRPVRLLMSGEGPQKEEWRQLASSLGVQAELTGWVHFADRARVYGRGQLLAVPSLWPEPFGLIGLDAASLGRPAVAFDVGGVRSWLTDGVNGTLVDRASGEAGLAAAIASMLASPAERERMGREALATARRMTVAHHVDQLEPILRRAAAA